MKKLAFNKFKDCIVDENNIIVAEKPHGINVWDTGQVIIDVFNRAIDSSTSISTTRVRFYPTDTDETFDGTVVEEKQNFYVVIPDQNLQLTSNWDKRRCDVIS